ncbi:glutathione S-transferase [Coccomyxa subellipsoidea C-169]|uniref:Glutathione S-transferase n=1 Tax=Coccomyxa subellipsoidea (strain C-169) TaxID=574566 RepID=I0YIF0_COCSC|nr:glutathione S-transferase [Coccomyxa subellipsoidea C-169]EIE18169.1 glutathione S-transferase [Coccomyxa subellipsoidea C-169]|eukprot:XP_005642713.1 glutathione S-transferase [Coccomyxa subellipsoidea C-169]
MLLGCSCPYAQRAWIALEELGLAYTTTLIDATNKAEDFKVLYASIVQNTEDPAKVPTIVDGDTKLTESLVIVEYLDAKYGGKKGLLPKDPVQLAQVKLFVELFTNKFSSYIYKMLSATSEEEVNTLGRALEHNLTVLDKFITASGSREGGTYFLGGRYSYAETVTTPFLRRALLVLKAHRGFDILDLASSNGLNRLLQWIQASLDRESNKSTGPSDEQIVQSAKKWLGAALPDYQYKSAGAA